MPYKNLYVSQQTSNEKSTTQKMTSTYLYIYVRWSIIQKYSHESAVPHHVKNLVTCIHTYGEVMFKERKRQNACRKCELEDACGENYLL